MTGQAAAGYTNSADMDEAQVRSVSLDDMAKSVAYTPVASYLDANIDSVQTALFCRHQMVQQAGLMPSRQAARGRQLVTCRY